jgi:Peptidase family S41
MGFLIDVGGGSGFPEDLARSPASDINPSEFVQGKLEQQAASNTGFLTFQAEAVGSKLDIAERRRVLNAVIKNMKDHYFDHVRAQKMARELLVADKRRNYDGITDAAVFANLLTRQIREMSDDMHLEVVYSERPLPAVPAGPTPEELAHYREALDQENCTFEKVDFLPHNVGYIKLNSFPDSAICGSKAKAVMASLNNVDAIIFDLRSNGGGAPEMVELIASYLFDHPEYWYNPREAPTRRSWTHSPVPRNRLADKPVFVLTSSATISGGEQFCYDLKMLKRAILIGETTHGSAHAGVFYRIDDHFGMGIPEVKAINPYSTTDWEGVGVEPTVRVTAADALTVAEKLARRSTLAAP